MNIIDFLKNFGIIEVTNEFAFFYILEYQAKVFPLCANTKIPLKGTHGRLDATDKTEVIKAHYMRNNNLNYAVAPDVSGLAVLDVDCHNDNGLVSLVNLINDNIITKHDLTGALIQTTPNNGLHLIWRTVNPIKSMQMTQVSERYKSLDILCSKSQFVGAGSKIDGRSYRLIGGAKPYTDITQFPQELERLVDMYGLVKYRKPSFIPKPVNGEMEFVNYDGGSRNVYLTKIGGFMASRGKSYLDIYHSLQQANCQFSRPLQDREVETIARSVSKYTPFGLK